MRSRGDYRSGGSKQAYGDPAFRYSRVPASACLTAKMICSSVNRLLRIVESSLSLSEPWIRPRRLSNVGLGGSRRWEQGRNVTRARG
jgi:hypothetical protein